MGRGRKEAQAGTRRRLVCNPPAQEGLPEQVSLTYKLLSYPVTHGEASPSHARTKYLLTVALSQQRWTPVHMAASARTITCVFNHISVL